jgi:hypothetical protein
MPECPTCHTQSENDKDYDSPAFEKVYVALAMAHAHESGDDVLDWLNRNGFPNLTCCPECTSDGFIHLVGCTVAATLDEATADGEDEAS